MVSMLDLRFWAAPTDIRGINLFFCTCVLSHSINYNLNQQYFEKHKIFSKSILIFNWQDAPGL